MNPSEPSELPAKCPQCGKPLKGPQCIRCLLELGLLESPNEPPIDWITTDLFKRGTLDETDLPRRFGDFILEEELGRGGVGVVYRASNHDGQIVALKLLHAGAFATRDDIARFQTEAAFMQRLHHPGIIGIRSSGVYQGQVYLSMEWVPGSQSMSELVMGPIPYQKAAHWVLQVAEAIQYAHDQGICHRDIKPSNLLVCPGGRVLVTDFGLARSVHLSENLTRTGQVLGTPGFLAPEQVDSTRGTLGLACDVYGLGSLLYCLISGRPPFQAPHLEETFRQILATPPARPSLLNPGIPSDLELICLKALQKDLKDRFSSAGQMARELKRFLAGQPIKTRPQGALSRLRTWARTHHTTATLTAILIVGTLSALVVVTALWRRSQYEVRRTAEALAIQRMTRAGELFGSNRPGLALRELAEVLKMPLDQRVAAERALSALTWLPFPRLEQALEGHSAAIVKLQFTPDGSRLLSVSADHTVRMWILGSSHAETVIPHNAPLLSADLSPTGEWLATGDVSGRVRVFNLSPDNPSILPKAIFDFHHDGPVNHLEFHPTSPRLLSCSDDGEARIWQLKTNTTATLRVNHLGRVLKARFNRLGDRFITAGRDGTARIWDSHSGALIAPPLVHAERVLDARFLDDGIHAVTCSWDGSASVWNIGTSEHPKRQFSHPTWVNVLAVAPDQSSLLTGTQNGDLHSWKLDLDLNSPPKISHPNWSGSHDHAVTFLAVSETGDRWLSGALDGTIRVWTSSGNSPHCLSLSHPGPIRTAVFSRDGREIFSGMESGEILRWRIDDLTPNPVIGVRPPEIGAHWSKTGDAVWVLDGEGHFGKITHPAGEWIPMIPRTLRRTMFRLSHDESCVLLGHRNGEGALHGLSVGFPPLGSVAHTRGLTRAEYTQDNRYVVTGSWDRTARISNAQNGTPVSVTLHHDDTVSALEISPNQKCVATGSFDSIVKIWSIPNGEAMGELVGHGDAVRDLAWSPDGSILATASSDWSVRLWNPENLKQIGQPLSHGAGVIKVRFSSDGKWLATASRDRSARLWNVQSGTPHTPPLIHKGIVKSISFCPENKQLATASEDGSICVWDIATGLEVAVLPKLSQGGLHVEFHPSERTLLAVGALGQLATYSLPSMQSKPPPWLKALLTVIASHDINSPANPEFLPAKIPTLETFRASLHKYRIEPDEREWLTWFLGSSHPITNSEYTKLPLPPITGPR